ncbi:FtsW/RodA/SpoVE family cell cycle protein [Streptococcaceae bacterium ESL0729]|nr:FtsW/RodA/SpoVE family cell cycle protein [Streptococcaceae bacterium ESL0729]
MKTVLKKRNFVNYSILIPYFVLSIIGLVVVYSTTAPLQVDAGGNPAAQVISQTIFWILSLIIIYILYHLKLSFLRNTGLIKFIMWAEIGLLIVARFFAPEVNGAHGWILIGKFSVQPVEYLKILIVWQLAATFAKNQDEIYQEDIKGAFKGGWLGQFLLSAILIGMMPDMGNLILIFGIVAVMIFSSGISKGWFNMAFLLGSCGLFFGYLILKLTGGNLFGGPLSRFAYINKRLIAFLNPFEDVSDAGHQMANSYYAISNGGWFGRGLGNSVQKKGYLPEASTDFVYSIVIEEFGLILALVILALLFFLILRIMQVGIKSKDPFNSMMCIGVAALFLMQVFVNVGGLSGLIPETGVTFPFLSQGGNSLLILSVGVGFVLNISADEKRRELVTLAEQYEMQEELLSEIEFEERES